MIQDLLRGDAQAAFLNVASSAGQVSAGKFHPLAVVNHTRLKEYPNIPTMKEIGFADVGTVAWNGLFAPAATPKPVLEATATAVTKAVDSPRWRRSSRSRTTSSCRTSHGRCQDLARRRDEALAEHHQQWVEIRGGAVGVTLRS